MTVKEDKIYFRLDKMIIEEDTNLADVRYLRSKAIEWINERVLSSMCSIYLYKEGLGGTLTL